MSGTVADKKRLIRLTAGNLKNNSISIAGHYDFITTISPGGSIDAAE
jgi:hypothetical protein